MEHCICEKTGNVCFESLKKAGYIKAYVALQ